MVAAMSSAAYAPVDLWTAMRRGWRGRCPRCAAGPLFGGFLKMRSHCPACGLVLDPYRADDAPAYFTIFAVGHIIVPLVLVFVRYGNQPPLWGRAVPWLPVQGLVGVVSSHLAEGACRY